MQPTSALQLRLYRIDFPLAVALNRLWHSRLPRYGRGFIKNQSDLCYGAEHGGIWYAVAIWSNPVARALPQREWLELRRLAIAPDAPRNTASRMLAVMARLIRTDKPQVNRLISYQDTEAHAGTIYRASGWTATATRKGSEWSCPSRPRPKAQSAADKVRWEKVLRSDSSDTAEKDHADRSDARAAQAGDDQAGISREDQDLPLS